MDINHSNVTILCPRHAFPTPHLLLFLHCSSGCRCSLTSVFLSFYLASFPLQNVCAGVCSEAAERQAGKENVKILSVVWDRPRAHKLLKDTRVSSTLLVTKLCFYLGPKKKKNRRKDSQEHKSRKNRSGNLLARRSITRGDVKGTQTVSAEAVDPPHPSLSLFLPTNEKLCETRSWMYYRR